MSRVGLYPNGDGITAFSDPFWQNVCPQCSHAFWSVLCTASCPKCGNKQLSRSLGGKTYGQVAAERGRLAMPESGFASVNQNKSE